MSGIDDPAPNQSGQTVAPVSMRRAPQTWSWLLALNPLWALPLGYLMVTLGLSTNLQQGVGIGLLIGLISADKAQLKQAGFPATPSIAWMLVPPVYLWKRAKIVGEPLVKFWVGLVLYVLTIVYVVWALSGGMFYSLTTVPACPAVESDIIRMFNGLEPVKQRGIVGTSLSNVREQSFQDGIRTCLANANAKDGKFYSSTYKIYLKGGQALIDLVVD